MNLSEPVNRVIDLGRKIRAYYDSELPKRYPNYPLVGDTEVSVPPPPEEKELSDFLATLSDDMLYQLILIQHFYRGYFAVDEMADYYPSLVDTVGCRNETISELMADNMILAGELEDGLEELRKHKVNVDRLPLKKVKLRKR